MENLLSSPVRLSDLTAIRLLKKLFSCAGMSSLSIEGRAEDLSELERFSVVPLIFGLIPTKAFQRAKVTEPIKPFIREHFSALGVPMDEELIDVVKYIADRYYSTARSQSLRSRLRISDLKALDYGAYRRLLLRQAERCAVCGVSFDGEAVEELDHKLPWRLVGDIPDGSNWQILCSLCNKGKKAWISSIQSRFAFNWVYDANISKDDVHLETRFVILAQRRECEDSGCRRTPETVRLYVVKRSDTGLAVADNLVVRCEAHIPQRTSANE